MVGLRTQQIIQLESNVAKVVDPLGGSYFIESLTDEMEKRIWARVLEIEAMGDPEELSDKGWFKRYFEEAMPAYSQKISDGSLPKVGLNAFQIPKEQDTLLKEVVESKIEPCWSRIDEIKRFKESRDQARIKDVLLEVCEKSKDEEENLIHIIKGALLAGATMGEITAFEDLPHDSFIEGTVGQKVMMRLSGADAWAAFTATVVRKTNVSMLVRLSLEKEIIEEVTLHPVNRGFNSIIDATVHATRYRENHDPDLKRLIDYHTGIVRKCGGKRESEALALLMKYL